MKILYELFQDGKKAEIRSVQIKRKLLLYMYVY